MSGPGSLLSGANLFELSPLHVDEGERIGFLHEDKAAALGRTMAVFGQRDPIKVVANPKNLKFTLLDFAAQSRSLPDLDAAVDQLQVELGEPGSVLSCLRYDRATFCHNRSRGFLVHVGRKHHADGGVGVRDVDVLRQSEFRQQHDQVDVLVLQRGDVAR